MPNFISVAGSVELAREENRVLNHSLVQLIWCAGNRSFRFGIFSSEKIVFVFVIACYFITHFRYLTRFGYFHFRYGTLLQH